MSYAKKLAFLGILSGLAFQEALAEEAKKIDYSSENTGYKLMTEKELFLNLNAESRKTYASLSPEGQQLVLKVASQRCQGANECKGLGGCKTEGHACAGQNSCKGQGLCAIGDKNLVIQLVQKKMAEKRESLVK